MSDLHQQAYDKWATAVSDLSLQPAAAVITWNELVNIAAVLELVKDTSNYLFLPEGGGVHLSGAALSNEPGCIDLYPFDDRAYPYVTKASKLHFIRPGEDLAWSYFVLEAEALESIRGAGGSGHSQEPVFIDGGGQYHDLYRTRDDDGEEVHPNGTRRLRAGLYLLVNNISLYNEMDSHQGRHDKWGFENLQEHMRLLYRAFVEKTGSSDYLNYRRPPAEE